MFRHPVKLPRPPIDVILTMAALMLALAAGRALLASASTHDPWLDIFFLGSVTLFLLGAVRCLVRTFDIEREVDELSAVKQRSPDKSNATRK